MKKFVLLVRPGCTTCEEVSSYLKSKGAEFEEWNVESEIIIERLMKDPKFTKRYCDVEECYSLLPGIRLIDTGEYYFGDKLNSFKKFYTLNKLLEIGE